MEMVEELEGVPLNSLAGSAILMLASDFDKIDVLSVEMDVSKRSVSCFTQQSI